MADGTGDTDRLGVFISYSRDDLDFADQLDVVLGLAGFDPVLDRHGIHGAENWQEKLGPSSAMPTRSCSCFRPHLPNRTSAGGRFGRR
jgi:hypothetical protein